MIKGYDVLISSCAFKLVPWMHHVSQDNLIRQLLQQCNIEPLSFCAMKKCVEHYFNNTNLDSKVKVENFHSQMKSHITKQFSI